MLAPRRRRLLAAGALLLVLSALPLLRVWSLAGPPTAVLGPVSVVAPSTSPAAPPTTRPWEQRQDVDVPSSGGCPLQCRYRRPEVGRGVLAWPRPS